MGRRAVGSRRRRVRKWEASRGFCRLGLGRWAGKWVRAGFGLEEAGEWG